MIQQYVEINSLDLTSLLNQALNIASKFTSQGMSLFAYVVLNIFAVVFSITNLAFYILLYFTLLSYFLHDKEDLIDLAYKIFPIDDNKKVKQKKLLSQAIRGVFVGNLQHAIY
jgi:predicted PurR-regulated permease PerM